MCSCINIEFGSYGNQVELQRPIHMPSTRGINTVCVDKCLKDEIIHLWSLGIITTGCCCGHNKGEQYPYIGVDETQIQLMKDMCYLVRPHNIDSDRQDSFIPKTKL